MVNVLTNKNTMLFFAFPKLGVGLYIKQYDNKVPRCSKMKFRPPPPGQMIISAVFLGVFSIFLKIQKCIEMAEIEIENLLATANGMNTSSLLYNYLPLSGNH